MSSSNILICGTNWLGDSIMSMPAVQLLKKQEPSCRITMLVKPGLVSLWGMHPSIDDVLTVDTGLAGTRKTIMAVKRADFDRAFVFPNSFRSAVIPFLANVPCRAGVPGHQRAFMLTNVVRLNEDKAHFHQMWEYIRIVGGIMDCEVDKPRLKVRKLAESDIEARLGCRRPGRLIGLMPGAAHGPSKRWPAEHFIAAGRRMADMINDSRVLVFGSMNEGGICSGVAEGIGVKAVNLGGKTSLVELAELLGLCDAVITNDSGGMHLAAAVGTKVVAVFGITDPEKTGPLGAGHRIIVQSDVVGSRDIERVSQRAEECLRLITPDRVVSAVMEVLDK